MICPVGLSLSCQDKARCPLTVMPSAHWCSVFLFKQTRGGVIHFLHRSRHEHTEVYSHDPSEPCQCAGITRTRHAEYLPSYFLDLSVSFLLSAEGNKIKSGPVPGAFVPSSLPCVVLHLSHLLYLRIKLSY